MVRRGRIREQKGREGALFAGSLQPDHASRSGYRDDSWSSSPMEESSVNEDVFDSSDPIENIGPSRSDVDEVLCVPEPNIHFHFATGNVPPWATFLIQHCRFHNDS